MFQKGKSGNPGGRTKQDAYLKTVAKRHTIEAVETLVKALKAENEGTRVAAANALLDRGWGKPQQSVETTIRDERMVVSAPVPEKDPEEWASKHQPKVH